MADQSLKAAVEQLGKYNKAKLSMNNAMERLQLNLPPWGELGDPELMNKYTEAQGACGMAQAAANAAKAKALEHGKEAMAAEAKAFESMKARSVCKARERRALQRLQGAREQASECLKMAATAKDAHTVAKAELEQSEAEAAQLKEVEAAAYVKWFNTVGENLEELVRSKR